LDFLFETAQELELPRDGSQDGKMFSDTSLKRSAGAEWQSLPWADKDFWISRAREANQQVVNMPAVEDLVFCLYAALCFFVFHCSCSVSLYFLVWCSVFWKGRGRFYSLPDKTLKEDTNPANHLFPPSIVVLFSTSSKNSVAPLRCRKSA
jgi:hypothetical protein